MKSHAGDEIVGKSVALNHFEWIDILRGLAAYAVVIFHVRIDLWVGWNAIHQASDKFSSFDRLSAYLSILTPFFGSTVMLFFLLSGFCIHYPHAKGRAFEFQPYISRRMLRIYPPYLMAVVFAVGVEYVALHFFQRQGSSGGKIIQSILMVQGLSTPPSQMIADASLWSLPVEVELYLLYPVFLWLSLKNGLARALFITGGVSLAALIFSQMFQNSIGWMQAAQTLGIHWVIWCAGAGLAELAANNRLPAWRFSFWLTAAFLLALAIFLQLRQVNVGIQHLCWAFFYFFVLLWGLVRPNGLNLSETWKRPLAGLGLISYSLYLIHYPVFYLCGQVWVRMFGSKPANFFVSLLFSFLVLPLAYLFFRCFELPSHQIAKRTKRKVG